MAERLAGWTREQGAVLDDLARLAPAVREVVSRAIAGLRPAFQEAAARLQQRPERVAARQRAAELDAVRAELLALRMAAFQRGQRWGTTWVDAGMEQFWAKAQAEEKKQREAIHALAEAALRQALRQENVTQQAERQQRQAAMRFKGPSPGM